MPEWSVLRQARSRPLRVALLACAGLGQRSGADRPKQYVAVAGRSVVHWTLQAFGTALQEGLIDGIAVVLSPGDQGFEMAVPEALRRSALILRVGGASRAHSVLGGLKALSQAGLAGDDWVLVHDAARCLTRGEDLCALIHGCGDDAVGGLLAHPVTDTLKRADPQGRVAETVPRETLWAAQTPQMFRLGLLERCLAAALDAGAVVTDEAAALEWAGHAPRLVLGPADNFKVTYENDFQRAAAVLSQRTI